MENWKVVKGFEAYEVSDLGKVRRVLPGKSTRVGNLRKLVPDKDGYLVVNLQHVGEQKNYFKKVHRLVAQAFIPNPTNLPEVNHTGRKTDNRASKLAWISDEAHGKDVARREQNGDGVCFNKERGMYMVRYNPAPNRRVFLGYFRTKKEALTVRRAAVEAM